MGVSGFIIKAHVGAMHDIQSQQDT